MIWIHRSILKYKYFNDGRISKFGRNPIPNLSVANAEAIKSGEMTSKPSNKDFAKLTSTAPTHSDSLYRFA